MNGSAWANAMTALQLLSVDPAGLGGIWVGGRFGPPLDQFLKAARQLNNRPWRNLTPNIMDEALFGGLDISNTLATGAPVFSQGVLAGDPKFLVLANAERCSPDLAARLGNALDSAVGHCLIASDEGVYDEISPPSLTDRLAFHLSLDDLAAKDCILPDFATTNLTLTKVEIDDKACRDITLLAIKLGISGLRAPLFAIRAAKASAKLHGRAKVTTDDLELAAALVLGPRATTLPQDESPPPPPQKNADEIDTPPSQNSDQSPPDDILLEAVLARLPEDILAKLAAGQTSPNAKGTSAHGAKKLGQNRGRPLPPRKGKPNGRQRIDLISTIRAAAPWQSMRQKTHPKSGLHIRAEDINLRRYQSRSDRLLIFAVDASGSAAMNRLAEAKGAIELLLADAYASRDHVALISYNKTDAELRLPPTRSLVRTKRQLAKLPGGGGTPLATGLKAALDTATRAKRKGFLPAIVLIADGRANIDLQGNADRPQAFEDAMTIAKTNKLLRTPGVIIDMSKRPEAQLKEISAAMDLSYLPLPFADARRLSNSVNHELDYA